MQWAFEKWKNDWSRSTSTLHQTIPSPSEDYPSKGLTRLAAVRLNRLLAGVGRFGANMQKWNLSSSALCECGEVHTQDHIIADCRLHKPPNGIEGLLQLDHQYKQWLTGNSDYLPIWRQYEKRNEDLKICMLWSSSYLKIAIVFMTLCHVKTISPFLLSTLDNTFSICAVKDRWCRRFYHVFTWNGCGIFSRKNKKIFSHNFISSDQCHYVYLNISHSKIVLWLSAPWFDWFKSAF